MAEEWVRANGMAGIAGSSLSSYQSVSEGRGDREARLAFFDAIDGSELAELIIGRKLDSCGAIPSPAVSVI